MPIYNYTSKVWLILVSRVGYHPCYQQIFILLIAPSLAALKMLSMRPFNRTSMTHYTLSALWLLPSSLTWTCHFSHEWNYGVKPWPTSMVAACLCACLCATARTWPSDSQVQFCVICSEGKLSQYHARQWRSKMIVLKPQIGTVCNTYMHT